MKLSGPLLAASLALLTPAAARPAETAVDTEEVLAMMDLVPSVEVCKRGQERLCTQPYRWSHVGQANRIAWSIAHTAKSREQAAYMTVFGIREGGNVVNAVGDGGKSHGEWQLSVEQAPVEVATDPDKAAPIWLHLAEKSWTNCASLPEDEQLAQVASGNCEHGRRLAARRAALVHRVLSNMDGRSYVGVE